MKYTVYLRGPRPDWITLCQKHLDALLEGASVDAPVIDWQRDDETAPCDQCKEETK